MQVCEVDRGAGLGRSVLAGLTLLLAVAAGAVPVRAQEESELDQQMRAARALVDQVKGLRGEERAAALGRAAAAYRAIIASHPADESSCARAWFEVGELERRKADLGAAEQAYARAADLDAGRFGARALLQCAHMQRRQARADEALVNYRKVVEFETGDSARRHEARIWIGSCLQSRGDLAGAIASFRATLADTTVPMRVIEVANKLARVQIESGDLAAAEASLARAESVVPTDASKDAARLRKAVDAMSARRALQRARDKANNAHQDAADLEKSRR